jgi:hypothetical protein
MFDYRGWLRRAAKEPFVHFLLLGVLVFAFNAWRDTRADLSDRHIVVTQADVQRLVALYMQRRSITARPCAWGSTRTTRWCAGACAPSWSS